MTTNTDTTAPAAPANTAATVTLEYPITRGASTITQLHLRKPKAGALRGIGESVVPTVIMLFSFVVFRQIYLYLATTMIADEQLRFVIVALAYPVGWMLCSALEAIAYHRSRLFHPALKKAEA